MTEGIRVIKASLDVVRVDDGDVFVLRGVIDPESLSKLLAADYQREILPSSSVVEMEQALASAEVPDIDLGMRGERTRNITSSEDGEVFFLYDSVYIIDGLQRVTAAKNLVKKRNGRLPRLGVVVHLNTTEEWERKRFHILNSDRVRLNSNVLLRNFRYNYPGVDAIYRMCEKTKDFVLHRKVSWHQRMKRQEVITAVSMLKVVAALHSQFGPGRSSKVADLARGWEKIFSNVGQRVSCKNIKLFYQIIDECWGLRNVAYRESSPQLKITFQIALANLFSNHLNFWSGEKKNKFVVPAQIKKKLSLFQLMDPHIANLASSPGPARDILYTLLIDHVNRGRRTRKLEPRTQENSGLNEDEFELPDYEEEGENGCSNDDE